MKPIKNYPSELYLNGKWLKSEDAFVSVFDRAFMFGDGIYEVTPFYSGRPFLLQEHLDRIRYCLQEIKLKFDVSGIEDLMMESLVRSGLEKSDAAVYLQISRGTAPRTHFFPEKSEPNFLLYAFPVKLENFEEKEWKILISEDFRWQRCDIKSTALLANTMANEEAIAGGYDENLLVRDGYFTEGSHSTAFFVKNDILHTHPEGPHILSGITRKEVINIARKLDIPVKEEALHLDELLEVQEIFLTGTTTQITKVVSLHNSEKELFRSPKWEITERLQEEFRRRTRSL